MNGSEKILPEHRERRAFIYARQSTAVQVVKHHTSTERQLDLTELAVGLGWSQSHVELVSEDLGRSGRLSENRSGFQRLAAEMSLGQVGAVLSTDASRLARSSADWHRLLEVAALTRTLLIDEQTVYDPRDPNDRLLLGMKGTMADFELVWLRQRMDGGRWHLARKGEYRKNWPAGYVYDGNRLVIDPSEEIQRAVRLLFERFRVGGSCRDVVEYFERHGLGFPSRRDGHVVWSQLVRCRVREVLRNPTYAGAYVYGRSHTEIVLRDGQRREHVDWKAMEHWPVLIEKAHEGYIAWEEFVANQKRLMDMARPSSGVRGAPREGAALLQGMLVCGHCGHRVQVAYNGTNGRYPSYRCARLASEGVTHHSCFSISVRNVDPAVADIVLGMLTAERLDAATRVAEIIEQEEAGLDQQWKLRLERARYEGKRAERQYDACDPENRVVSRTLEKRWNDKLEEIERLEREYEGSRRGRRLELSDLDRQRIAALAGDMRRLWSATTTTDRDRKLLLRVLLKDIGIRAVEVPRQTIKLRLLWQSGAATDIEIDRAGTGGRGERHARMPRWRLIETTANPAPVATG